MAEILIGNVKGPQGDTGATGATGPQGEAATVNVGSVSTTAYGNAAQVINVGTENDAILNFVIPQGKPGERTTTMGGLTLDTITTSTAEFPSPQVGDTGATAFGKIVKFFADALSALQAKLDAANVVNNLTTTEAGYALDARQGKALHDNIISSETYLLYRFSRALNINGTTSDIPLSTTRFGIIYGLYSGQWYSSPLDTLSVGSKTQIYISNLAYMNYIGSPTGNTITTSNVTGFTSLVIILYR